MLLRNILDLNSLNMFWRRTAASNKFYLELWICKVESVVDEVDVFHPPNLVVYTTEA